MEEKVKISELEATNTINDEDILPIVQSGTTKKVTTANLLSDVYDTIEEVVDKEAYSTNETLTNKVWIDGKPIYRKVIDCGSLPNATTKTVNHSITNMDSICLINGSSKDTSGYKITLPFLDINNPTYGVMIYVDNTKINLVCGDNKSSYTKSYVILEYTKTTD